jgi:hypothetical protein
MIFAGTRTLTGDPDGALVTAFADAKRSCLATRGRGAGKGNGP